MKHRPGAHMRIDVRRRVNNNITIGASNAQRNVLFVTITTVPVAVDKTESRDKQAGRQAGKQAGRSSSGL